MVTIDTFLSGKTEYTFGSTALYFENKINHTGLALAKCFFKRGMHFPQENTLFKIFMFPSHFVSLCDS